MFRITGHKVSEGFQIVFANEWEISVQFGEHHYCSRGEPSRNPFVHRECKDAEVAVFDPSGNFIRLNHLWDNDDVATSVSPDDIARIITEVSAK